MLLDRGELDRLIDAENAWHGEPSGSKPAPASGSGPAAASGLGAIVSDVVRQAQAARSSSSGSYGSSSSHYGKKRKKSFLDEMFG